MQIIRFADDFAQKEQYCETAYIACVSDLAGQAAPRINCTDTLFLLC